MYIHTTQVERERERERETCDGLAYFFRCFFGVCVWAAQDDGGTRHTHFSLEDFCDKKKPHSFFFPLWSSHSTYVT